MAGDRRTGAGCDRGRRGGLGEDADAGGTLPVAAGRWAGSRAVVAITFTIKAAREMRNRVRRELSRYLERPDLVEAESACWREIYSRLDAARISTIHSLCSEILRAQPAEAGVDPAFTVLEEGQANILRAQAIDAALAWAAGGAEATCVDAGGAASGAGAGELRHRLGEHHG